MSNRAGIRLDQLLVSRGLAESRQKAQAMIMAGLVKVAGRPESKAGRKVGQDAQVEVAGPEHPYVSRGGVKLAGALDHFQLDPAGLCCLDLGASTGGFSDCLLQRGAASVTAVDVGYGQLAWKLRQDPRVILYERVNARELPEEVPPAAFDLVVADVSFISLTLVLAPAVARLKPGGLLLPMVKPQFEAGREQVGKGGVVRDPVVRQACLDKVAAFVRGLGLAVQGTCQSPLPGPSGNLEYFLLARRSG